jgi:hypothetical protein
MQLLNHIPINIGLKFVNLSLLSCRKDAHEPTGFCSGGFGTFRSGQESKNKVSQVTIK